MTNEEVLDALEKIKTYCAADLLDKLDCAIAIIEKLEADGIKTPLKTDFTQLAKESK
ncbi:MAG: hypothetical protein IJS09_07500 [Treponema sp.]|nr:hypothetical protein [Treponema sp.]